jgi:hypothetical protein
MNSPPGYPAVSGWGSYREVMDGAPVFVTAMNARTERFWAKEGTGMSGDGQEAVILGAEYFWDEQALSQSAALLWRTGYDSEDVRGWSGSILCQGKTTDAEVRAVILQNFEASLTAQVAEVDGRTLVPQDYCPMYKGGFLLPQEIRDSTIRLEQGGKSLEPVSLNIT